MKLLHPSRTRSSQADLDQLRASQRQLDTILDGILDQFSQRLSMAEVLVYLPRLNYLMTVAIRPDTAMALPTRARPDRKTILAHVLNTRVPFHGPPSDESGRPRMLETLSVRAIPITHGRAGAQQLLGVLNLESSDPGSLKEQSPLELKDLLDKIGSILAKLPDAPLASETRVVDFLLDMVEKRLVYILDPEHSDEIFHQLRLAAVNLTSPSDVVASIVLRHDEAYHLGLADKNPDTARTATSGQSRRHEWVYPIPNKGDSVPFPEKWDRFGEPSITRQTLDTGEIQNIPDVTDPAIQEIRKRLNSVYDQGSELNIPLKTGERSFGAFILLSSTKHAFNDADVMVATRIARCLELVTQQIIRLLVILGPLTTEQKSPIKEKQNPIRDVHERFDSLYTTLDFRHMPTIRDEALKIIARKAKERTGADVAAVVLAEEASNSEEQVSDGEEELVWSMDHCVSELGEPSADKPFRLRKTEGLIGMAYRTGKPLRVANVDKLDETELRGQYIPAFPQVISEMAVPIVGRNRTWGVIDVESVQPDHFTKGHLEWVKFLAEEAVELLEAFETAIKRWYQGQLEDIDGALARMRAANDPVEVQRQRENLLRDLIKEVRDLTRAEKVQIYIAINTVNTGNAGDPDDAGVLGAVIVEPAEDMNTPGFHKNIGIHEGMAGKVVKTRTKLFFKERAHRPQEYIVNLIDAESALVVPVLEGPRVLAILNLESEKPRWCGALQITVATYAATLIANIQVAYTLTLERLQTEKLLTFDTHQESPDVTPFMQHGLQFADQLTVGLAPRRWGLLALVEDGTITYAVTGQMPGVSTDAEGEEIARLGLNSYSAFQRVIKNGRPVLIPNLEQPPFVEDREGCPWNEAKSLLCVPLMMRHMESGAQPAASHVSAATAGFVTIGLLTIAASKPYMLNDSDKTALLWLAPRIVHGLEDIAALYSRVSLMNVLRSEFSALGDPDPKPFEKLRVAIQKIPLMADSGAAALETASNFDHHVSPFLLLAQLPQLYLLLMKDYPFSPAETGNEPGNPLMLESAIDSLKPLIAIYVAQELDSKVLWDSIKPSPDYDSSKVKLTIDANDPDGPQLLKAAIFGCVSTAVAACFQIEDERQHDICITVTTTAQNKASITVEYVGKPISDSEQFSPLLRHAHFGARHTVEIPELQLSQVNRIARRLGGELSLGKPGTSSIHTITLTIPCTL